MNLPTEAVTEFQNIYKRKCGIELSFNEAEIKAENFLRLIMLITKSSKDENEKLYKNTKRTF
jgi:hypothetical protein